MSYHFPRKRFGQHFLRDLSVIDHIISEIIPTPKQLFVEIGPGLGALTTKILPLVKKMHVIEIDRDIIPKLEESCRDLGELIIHCEDVLKFDFSALVHDQKKLRVIGNLPYNISTPLLFHLFQQLPFIQDMHFMLQKEVAERITATVGESSYGHLSIMTQYYCQTEILFTVPPEVFFPKPKVHSAFVRFIPHQKKHYQISDIKLLSDIIRQAFMKRRKTLYNALKHLISESELKQLDINPQLRPQQISIDDYIKIANRLCLVSCGSRITAPRFPG